MRVRLKGVNKVTRKLADGSVRVHYYLRETKAPLPGKPGSVEFMNAYNAAIAKLKTPPAGELRSIISRYKASPEFTGKAEKTRVDYLGYIKKIEAEFGDLPIAALEDMKVREVFLEWRDGMAKTPRAADYAWTMLSRILAWAKHRSLIGVNHCKEGGRIYKGGNRKEIVWTADDIKALAEHASPEVMAVVIVALWTGQRQGDVLEMTWSALVGSKIKVKQFKTGARVLIPVGATLRKLLDSLQVTREDAVQILRNTRGKAWTEDGFKTSLGKAKTKAGLKLLHFHDLRGTAVTRMALAGCTVPMIASITGHSLEDVNAILSANYLGGQVELAEQAVLLLESRYGDADAK